MLAVAGCRPAPTPLLDSREALGTVVSMTAYPAEGDDQRASSAVARAYDEMTAVEKALDVYDPASQIARINASGSGTLPPEAVAVFAARDDLGVAKEFSPFLFEVVRLYDFEGTGTVPAATDLHRALVAAEGWRVTGARIESGADTVPAPSDRFPAGLDFGGAAKGLALDRAARALQEGFVSAALITAGSTTVTFGEKPDGEPWRIGIEDPRDAEDVVATVEAPGPVTVSTSGDYQRYFEIDGVRYHHILDPVTGKPARGLRSLSVIGATSGLDSDILSTALFVMGEQRARAYAEEHGLGLVTVNDEGRVLIVPGPADASWRIVEATR